MIPGVHIISGKASMVNVNGAGGLGGALTPLVGGFKKVSGSKEHLDWLKIDLHVTKIITVQDYKHTKKIM